MRLAFLALMVTISASSLAYAQQCGDPPRVDDQSFKGELEGKAKFLSSLIGDATLKGHIETARTDIFSKYPDANRAHTDSFLLYMLCTFVLTDPKWTAQEKFRAIQEFQQTLAPHRGGAHETPATPKWAVSTTIGNLVFRHTRRTIPLLSISGPG